MNDLKHCFIKYLWVFSVFGATSTMAMAQSQCPPGMLPGLGKCLSQQEILRSKQWIYVNSWGALTRSIYTDNSIIGTSNDVESSELAISLAMSRCGDSCEVWKVYGNACIAVAENDAKLISSFIGMGLSESEASRKAVAKCKDRNLVNCRTTYSACSLPRLVEVED